MPHLQIANQVKRLRFTPFEREIVIGCLLGDGTLSKSGKEYRLRVEHQAAHREYVEWKYNQLQRFCVTASQFLQQHQSYRFGTVGHPELTRLRTLFYKDGRKILPDFIGEGLSSLALAILFMDDGGRINNTVSFALHCYSQSDVELIQKALQRLNVDSRLHFDGHACSRRLYVTTSSYATFKGFVKPYVEQVPCMAYKLP